MLEILLSLHAIATIMMTGLIWFVQIVHYPLFPFVGARDFVQYEREHVRRTTWIVAPLMGLEAFTAVALVLLAKSGAMLAVSIAGLLLVALIWAMTALLQVPCHSRLSTGFDALSARRLVATNWLRTVAWTARAGLAVVMPFLMLS